MKLKWNLSLTAKPAQRCAQVMKTETPAIPGSSQEASTAERSRKFVPLLGGARGGFGGAGAKSAFGVALATAAACTVRRNSPFDLLTARANRPIRIPAPIIAARPVLRGDKSYLRALRAAEMALWEANLKFPGIPL